MAQPRKRSITAVVLVGLQRAPGVVQPEAEELLALLLGHLRELEQPPLGELALERRLALAGRGRDEHAAVLGHRGRQPGEGAGVVGVAELVEGVEHDDQRLVGRGGGEPCGEVLDEVLVGGARHPRSRTS